MKNTKKRERDFESRVTFLKKGEDLASGILAATDEVFCRKLAELKDDLTALREVFKQLRVNEKIAGCATWAAFCTTKLHRTDRAVRHLLQEGGRPKPERNNVPSSDQGHIEDGQFCPPGRVLTLEEIQALDDDFKEGDKDETVLGGLPGESAADKEAREKAEALQQKRPINQETGVMADAPKKERPKKTDAEKEIEAGRIMFPDTLEWKFPKPESVAAKFQKWADDRFPGQDLEIICRKRKSNPIPMQEHAKAQNLHTVKRQQAGL